MTSSLGETRSLNDTWKRESMSIPHQSLGLIVGVLLFLTKHVYFKARRPGTKKMSNRRYCCHRQGLLVCVYMLTDCAKIGNTAKWHWSPAEHPPTSRDCLTHFPCAKHDRQAGSLGCVVGTLHQSEHSPPDASFPVHIFAISAFQLHPCQLSRTKGTSYCACVLF